MTTVLLVDDHPVVRAGLTTLINTTDDLTIVGEAGGGEQAVALVGDLEPEVVLMDLSMPGMDGIEATRRILLANPHVRVVVLTSFADEDRVADALAAGAVGYLLKDTDAREVLAGIRSAALGHAPLDPRVARALLPSATPRVKDTLSIRDLQVLRLVAKGLANKQIGRSLGISERTVKVHVGHVFRRVGVADRTSAAIWARENLDDDERG
ncbi:MAG TPA: response regulator transcription factor [Dermatophilaceae bacterium]